MKIFITGIGTDVGKTITSAIVTQALEADYWKPIQAGDLENSDTHKLKSQISNPKSQFHPNAYATLDGLTIDLKRIIEPITDNHLVIEGAGGILVPLNETDCIIDLIQPEYKVIIVSRHYLGSINHTLMTIEILKSRNINIAGIIFSGDENKSTEAIILNKTGLNCIGRIENEPYFDENVIKYYADKFRDNLLLLEKSENNDC